MQHENPGFRKKSWNLYSKCILDEERRPRLILWRPLMVMWDAFIPESVGELYDIWWYVSINFSPGIWRWASKNQQGRCVTANFLGKCLYVCSREHRWIGGLTSNGSLLHMLAVVHSSLGSRYRLGRIPESKRNEINICRTSVFLGFVEGISRFFEFFTQVEIPENHQNVSSMDLSYLLSPLLLSVGLGTVRGLSVSIVVSHCRIIFGFFLRFRSCSVLVCRTFLVFFFLDHLWNINWSSETNAVISGF